MSTYLTTRAIILQEEPLRERDIQYHILTEHEGIQRVVVRGGRTTQSKLRPHLLRFDRSIVTLVRAGTRSYVSHAAVEERLQIDAAIATRYRAAAIACALARVARPDVADHHELFNIVDRCLTALNRQQSKFLSVLFPVVAGALIVSGVRPQVERCGTCRKQIQNSEPCLFSMAHGSVFHQVCVHPEGGTEMTIPILRDAQAVLAGNVPRQPEYIFSFLVEFFKYHLEPRVV